MYLMKISDAVVKFYGVGITFPFLSMEMACVRPEVRVFSSGIGGVCACVSVLDKSCQH